MILLIYNLVNYSQFSNACPINQRHHFSGTNYDFSYINVDDNLGLDEIKYSGII